MSYQSKASGMMNDYLNVRKVPMVLSGAFLAASLYQFGGIGTITLEWLSYTLTADHAIMVSLGAWIVAFASSETKQFQYYDGLEKVAIALGPLVILGDYFTVEVTDLLLQIGDPLGMQIAFFVTVVSWGAAVK
ncbi:hypothetical protein [Haloarcula sp. JP-L23]|uniref:hypothetical protein n=1 Tax=Haloarcula sp. JP-L23 TaxID=2716717 RepID=UPI00140EE8DC|nr:hypothetical protein G9465_02820 [Haloarcula sp. JP-L23]